jgi:hypothetical protein
MLESSKLRAQADSLMPEGRLIIFVKAIVSLWPDNMLESRSKQSVVQPVNLPAEDLQHVLLDSNFANFSAASVLLGQ